MGYAKYIKNKQYNNVRSDNADAVAMGSTVGPSFSNYFKVYIENKILAYHKPTVYAWYTDKIFFLAQDLD